MYGITLVLTLAIIGGVIAYFGDKIGMKIGRKKLSLLGLRPKHTSILVTILTGIFIAISSIAVLTVVSNDVRTALFRMRAIQEALVISQQELAESSLRVEEMETNLSTLTEERDQTAEELEEARDDVERVTEEYEAVLADLEDTRQEVDAERERVEELEQRRAALEQRYVYLMEGYESLVNQYDVLVDEYLRLESKMRTGDLAMRADEIFHAAVFEAGSNMEDLTEQLSGFLEEADRRALVRGARLDSDQNLAIMLTQQTFELAVYSLHQQDGDVVVRAVSKNNTVAGEPVVTYLELIPDEKVFSQGEVLAETKVDSTVLQEVDRAIIDMVGQANERAVQAGMATADGAAVVVSGEQFLEAIAAAKESESAVEIRAVTKEDAWTTKGPISLDLEVVRL